MSHRLASYLTLALGVALLLAQPIVDPLRAVPPRTLSAPALAPVHSTGTAADYGQLPLAFAMNQGQADLSIRFLAQGRGYTLALTSGAALLAFTRPAAAPARLMRPGQPQLTPLPAAPTALLGMQWLGANPHPAITGEQPLPGTVNYFIGNNPTQWHTNIPTYQQVRLHDVYPGVDLVYYGTGGQLEYDFMVAAGASPASIQLGFTGASGLGVDLAGNLSLSLPGGTIAQQKPLIYQTAASGARQPIAGGYVLSASRQVSFALGAYNPRVPLVIDPAYRLSTYLGGSGTDMGMAIAVDNNGNAYITGMTASSDFPVVHGAFQPDTHGNDDVFVSKLNAAGTALIYSTYLGGAGLDQGNGIAVDAGGNAYLTGITSSTDFPTAAPLQASNAGNDDAFVTKLNATGSALVYSTYFGGSGYDYGNAIAIDSGGNAYITGYTDSTDFPIGGGTSGGNAGGWDAFVAKIIPSGATYQYSDDIGGSSSDYGYGIAVDGGGAVYVAGETMSNNFPTTTGAFQVTPQGSGDGFVFKLNAVGTALVYSTYLGGTLTDGAYGIAVDGSGDAYVTGFTDSTDFPTHNPLQASFGGAVDAFVSKLNPSGTALIYSTYLGGSDIDVGYAIAVDGAGNAAVVGLADSSDFPLVNPLQNSRQSSNGDAFVARLNAAGNALLFSTYLGGSSVGGDQGNDIALGAGSTVYVTGRTASTDFPTANALYPTFGGGDDAFVTKILTLPSVDTTTGVFRPSNGTLYLKNANTTGPADITLAYGQPGDLPITGDWTGKGYRSIGVYRNGTFYLRNSNTTGYADIVVPFGTTGDIPVAGDWTGKGYDSIGVYKPSTSTFYLRDSNTAGPPDHIVTLGISGDVPITGDWTGKGWDSVGVFRPSNGIVYLRNSNSTGYADISFVYGLAGDTPVVGDWTAQGKDTIGVDRNGHFLLRNSNTTGPANISFYLGVSGDNPIAGPWLAPS